MIILRGLFHPLMEGFWDDKRVGGLGFAALASMDCFSFMI